MISVAPFLTFWPSLKPMATTRPAISGRIVTDSFARSVPTASTVRLTTPSTTGVTSTTGGGIW